MKNFSRITGALLSLLVIFLFALQAHAASGRIRGASTGRGLTSTDITELKTKFGIKYIRWQMYHTESACNTETAAEYLAWLDTEIALIDTLIPSFQANSIQIILDLHSLPGCFETVNGEHASPTRDRIFTDQTFQDAFITAWQTLANHYKGNSTVAFFEVASEPHEGKKPVAGLKNWNKLAKAVYQAIRATGATQKLIFGVVNGDKITKFVPPAKNVYAAPHFYYPNTITRAGIEDNPTNVSCTTSTKKKMVSRLQAIKVFLKRNKKLKPKIVIAEFGVSRHAGDAAACWLNHAISIFESNKWSWLFFVLREADTWDPEIDSADPAVTTRSPSLTARGQILQTYFIK